MRRNLSVLLVFCLIFCMFPVLAFAENSTYDLSELGMSIEIPDNHIVFTRNIKSSDPNLSAYGLTKDSLSSLMLERDIYLNAWDKDVNYEIIVTMTDSPIEDLNLLSDTTLKSLDSSLKTTYESAGITYIKSDIYQHNQAKFIKIYISQPNNGGTAYGLQYYTVYNGKAINVTLHSYSGKINSTHETTLKNIVDTVHFDADPQLKDTPTQTDAFIYTDKNSGMSFTVPSNWVETPMSKEREVIDAKFSSILEEGLAIIFSSEDLYGSEEFKAEFSAGEQLLLNRDMIGNDLFSKADIAEIYGCSEKDVSIVNYGGKEYYFAEAVVGGTAYGITLSTPMVFLIRCENGYIYSFQFNSSSDSTYFKDFESLVRSAKYPVFDADDTARDQVIVSYILLAIIVLLALCFLTFFVIRKKKNQAYDFKKENATTETITKLAPDTSPVEEEHTPTLDSSAKESKEEPKPLLPENLGLKNNGTIAFCHKCGNKLVSGSVFCNKCGTKIPTADEK